MKTFFTLPLLLLAANVLAQSVTIRPSNERVEGDPADQFIKVIGHVRNAGTTPLDLTWVRENVNVPSGWTTAICDPNLCWSPMLGTADFTLDPTPSASIGENMYMQFYPNNVEGLGSADIAVYRTGTTTLETRNTYTAAAWLVGTTRVGKISVSVFPNPTVEFITLSTDTEVRSMVLSTLSGNIARSFVTNNTGRYSLDGLPQGVYMLQLMGNDGELLKTVRISKQGL